MADTDTDKLLSLRFDAVQDRDLIEYLGSLGKGNVSRVIKAALRSYAGCNTVCNTAVLQADGAPETAPQVAMRADTDLIVKGFEWKDQQDQARHDTLLAALDNLTAALSKLQVTGVVAQAPTPAPDSATSEPDRVSDEVLKLRAERMKRAAWAG